MKYSKLWFTVIVLFIFYCSCKSSKVYTQKELENIRITDSIANAQKQILIQDFQEEFQGQEQY